MKISTFDLNLFVILNAIYTEGSLTKAAEVVGNRIKCEDFDDYKHLFEGIDRDLKKKNS